jgi:hypothetical protein
MILLDTEISARIKSEEKIAKPLHSVTIKHLSKSGKLSEVGKIL